MKGPAEVASQTEMGCGTWNEMPVVPFPTGTQEEGQTQRKAAFLWGWGSWSWKHPGDRSAVPTICWRLAGFPHRPG